MEGTARTCYQTTKAILKYPSIDRPYTTVNPNPPKQENWRFHWPYIVLTVLAFSELAASIIALMIVFSSAIPVDFPVISMTTIVATIASSMGAIFLLFRKKSGLYLSTFGLVIWSLFAALLFAVSFFPLIGVGFMIAELVVGWKKVIW